MSNWREILCRDVDWLGIPGTSRRAGHKVRFLCRHGKEDGGTAFNSGPWFALTLGELADIGIRAWRREEGIGTAGEFLIKAAIDAAAAGIAVTYPAKSPDAYIPECERSPTISERFTAVVVHRDLGPGFTHSEDGCPCEPHIITGDDDRPTDEIISEIDRRERKQ